MIVTLTCIITQLLVLWVTRCFVVWRHFNTSHWVCMTVVLWPQLLTLLAWQGTQPTVLQLFLRYSVEIHKCTNESELISWHKAQQESIWVAQIMAYILWYMYEGSVTKEISYTISRSPIEFQKSTLKSQKSNLKSRNPPWNPKIQSQIPACEIQWISKSHMPRCTMADPSYM